ncbi:MAG: DUF222 domain-containing protein [Dermatophilus congolensis]|nr:DUF222 domain-containing protein [Dermatophilus congolensis]
MPDTATDDPREAGWWGAQNPALEPPTYEWGRSARDTDPDYWTLASTESDSATRTNPWEPTPGAVAGADLSDSGDPVAGLSAASRYWDSILETPTTTTSAATTAAGTATSAGPAVVSAAGEELLAQLESVQQILASMPERLTGVYSPDLAGLAAQACALVAAAEAVRAAVVLDADARGVIASSDNPRVDRFVERAHRDANAPVSSRAVLALKDIARVCQTPDVSPLREAITAGRISVDTAASAARFFRKLQAAIGPGNWEPVLEAIIDAVAAGATARELDSLAEVLISQYGDEGALDRDHDAKYVQRDMTTFRRDRHGMLTATLRLDPASEAVVTAALTALSIPTPTPDGDADLRTPGQRRADALVSLAQVATRYDGHVPGTGTKAKVLVTISHETLSGAVAGMGLTEHGHVLTPSEVRALACEAGIIPVVLGGRGEVLDVGREERFTTPAQRNALIIRDRGCTFPGCDAPPSWCEGHHLLDWDHHGPTDMGNLALICKRHHVETHRYGHVGTITPEGVIWTRGDGSAIGNIPRDWLCH